MPDTETITWEEATCAAMIAKIRRSRWAKDCFADAMRFHKNEGFSMVCALKISANYWLS